MSKESDERNVPRRSTARWNPTLTVRRRQRGLSRHGPRTTVFASFFVHVYVHLLERRGDSVVRRQDLLRSTDSSQGTVDTPKPSLCAPLAGGLIPAATKFAVLAFVTRLAEFSWARQP